MPKDIDRTADYMAQGTDAGVKTGALVGALAAAAYQFKRTPKQPLRIAGAFILGGIAGAIAGGPAGLAGGYAVSAIDERLDRKLTF